MPAITKRRKAATRSITSTLGRARGIAAFTKVSKTTTPSKTINEKEVLIESTEIAVAPEPKTRTNKRKLDDFEEEGAVLEHRDEAAAKRAKLPVLPQTKPLARGPQTPKKPIVTQIPSSIETPTKAARNLLDNFRINSTTPTHSPLKFNSSSSELCASTPGRKIEIDTPGLPAEVHDLINLHASFLTALSIHYAHNGTHSPADLRNLCPDVARSWGKRRVTLEDIRRTLGILNSPILEAKYEGKISMLYLSDYGHGKICIEINQTPGKAGRIARPVNEDIMNTIFVKSLQSLWDGREPETTPEKFVEDLPLDPITICPSLLKISPLLAKGQRRLEDLKAGIIMKKEDAKKENIEPVTTPTGKKPTLLERLRAKSLHNSSLPAPPSKPELARKAALGRIEEVVGILAVLSTSTSAGQQRISFTLPTIIGNLKDSFKTPISKEEADTCIRLLAHEIAPEWVKILKMGKGKMEALVVDREGRIGDDEVRGRVARAS